MIWPLKSPKHPAVARYLASKPQQRRHKRDLSEVPIVLLDAETSGFNVGVDRLLTLGMIRLQGMQIAVETARSWTVFQEKPILNEAVKVHGILPSQTKGGTPEKQVLLEFLDELQDAIIVGHHIAFDIAVLNEATKKHFRVPIKNRCVDTAYLAMQELTAFKRTGYANQRPPSLDDLSNHLNMPVLKRHTALGDAYTTGLLFLNLCARCSRRLGRPAQLRDLPR